MAPEIRIFAPAVELHFLYTLQHGQKRTGHYIGKPRIIGFLRRQLPVLNAQQLLHQGVRLHRRCLSVHQIDAPGSHSGRSENIAHLIQLLIAPRDLLLYVDHVLYVPEAGDQLQLLSGPGDADEEAAVMLLPAVPDHTVIELQLLPAVGKAAHHRLRQHNRQKPLSVLFVNMTVRIASEHLRIAEALRNLTLFIPDCAVKLDNGGSVLLRLQQVYRRIIIRKRHDHVPRFLCSPGREARIFPCIHTQIPPGVPLLSSAQRCRFLLGRGAFCRQSA